MYIFQCLSKVFWVECQRQSLKFHPKISTTEIYDFYTTLKFWELLYLRAHAVTSAFGTPSPVLFWFCHYSDIIVGATASEITSLTIVYSTADLRKHQSSASLAFVWGIYRWPVISPHKWPVTRKMFPCLMSSSWIIMLNTLISSVNMRWLSIVLIQMT